MSTKRLQDHINNSISDVQLLVIGERKRPNNKIYYAKNPDQKEKRNDWWHDWPEQEMGSHDGLQAGLRNKIIKTKKINQIE